MENNKFFCYTYRFPSSVYRLSIRKEKLAYLDSKV